MVAVLWGLGILLTCAGLVLYWNAQVLAADSFYFDASLILLLALLCVGLAKAWPWGTAWLRAIF